jgi:hypothetical protein
MMGLRGGHDDGGSRRDEGKRGVAGAAAERVE